MTSTNMISLIGAIIALVSAICAAVFSYLAIRNTKLSQHAQSEKEAGDAYDRMVAFRVANPAVMLLSREWRPGNFEKLYKVTINENNDRWVIYYSYAELCIGYCNIVLSAWYEGLLSEIAFENRHKLSIKLLLTENYPLINELVLKSKYLSKYITKFYNELEDEGWNWLEEHELLTS